MRELPFDLVVDILAKVPVKGLIRFRCVCKSWWSLFQDERFIRQHMTHAPLRIVSLSPLCHFVYESGKAETILQEVALNIGNKSLLLQSGVIGHCHGLFCLDLKDDTFGVWNPSLREFRRIPTRHLKNWALIGFGYDHSTQDYKIVLVPGSCSRAQVLSLKAGVSRMIDFPCLENFVMSDMKIPGTFVGENIYWKLYDDNLALTDTILSFDLVSETFNYCPGPKTCGKGFPKFFLEGLRGGGLCTVGIDSRDDLIVWSSQHDKENNIGVIKSWSKIISLSRGIVESSINRRIGGRSWLQSATTYAGLLLFIVSVGRDSKLLAYNLEEKSLRNVETSCSLDRCGGLLLTYIETLVPIPGGLVRL